MANTSNLSAYLKDVADAIREKKGIEEQIPAANFDTEIRSIETGSEQVVYNSLDEIKAIQNPKQGQICTVFNTSPLDLSSKTVNADVIYLPTLTEEEYNSLIAIGYLGTIFVNGTSYLFNDINNISTGDGGASSVYTKEGDVYVPYWGSYVLLEDFVSASVVVRTRSVTVDDPSSPVWNYIKFYSVSDVNSYQYNTHTDSWNIVPNSYSAYNSSQLIKDVTALGKRGKVTGALDLSRKLKTMCLPAIPVTSILENNYTKSSYLQIGIDITDEELLNFADKKYVFYSVSGNMMDMQSNIMLVDDNAELVLTSNQYEIMITSTSKYRTFNKDQSGTLYNPVQSKPSLSTMSNMPNFGTIGTSVSSTGLTLSIPLESTGGYICTNCKIVDNEGNVLVKPEPTRNDVSTGTNFTNLFGINIEGTAETGGTTINNQDKVITENGEYSADEGYTGLGNVTVNIPQTGDVPVKLFKTEEEMRADATAKEGDLAVVYRSEVQAFKEDTQTQFITFPETVVLDTAFTDNINGRLRTVDPSKMFDGNVILDQNRFGFDGFSETGMIRIEYMSSDGITYTRSRMEGDTGELTNPVDLGTEIKWEPMEPFNPVIGKFMKVGGSTFEGLFTAKNVTDKNKPIVLKGIYYDSGTKYTDQYILSNYDKVLTVLQKITALHTFNTNLFVCYNKTTNQYTVYGTDNSDASGGISLNTYDNYYNICIVNKKSNASCYKYILDIENNTYTEENLTTSSIVHTNPSSGSNWHNFESISEQYILPLSSDVSKIHSSVFYYKGKDNTSYYQASFETTYGETLTWHYAPTQLTLEEANQLLPGRIAYGKNGVVTGDGSIWDSIPSNIVLKDILKLNDFYNNGSTSLFKNIFETIGNIESNKEVTYLKRNSSGEYLVLAVNDVITSKTYLNYYNGTPIIKLNDGLRCTDYHSYGFIIRNIDNTEPLFTCSTRSKILKLKDNYLYYISLVGNAYKLLKLNTDNYEITEISTLLTNADAGVYISFNGDYKYAFISICGGQNSFPGRRAILFDFDTEELVDVLNVSYKCYSFAIRYKDKIYFEYKLGSSSNSNIDLLSINLSNGSVTKLLTNATSASFANVTDYNDLESNEAIGEDENYVYLNFYERLNKATGIITRDMTPVINDLDLSASNLRLKKYVNETYYAIGGSNTYLCLCNIQINDTTVTVTGKKYYLGNQAYISIENELMDISILDKTIIGDICKLQSNEGIYLECTGYTYSLSSSIDYDLAVVNGSTDTGFINQVIISDNTLSQTEYDTALDTTKQILGEEV